MPYPRLCHWPWPRPVNQSRNSCRGAGRHLRHSPEVAAPNTPGRPAAILWQPCGSADPESPNSWAVLKTCVAATLGWRKSAMDAPLEVLMLLEGETGFLSRRRARLGGWRTVLWYQGRSRMVPWYCQGSKGVPGAILSIANTYPSQNRRQMAEFGMKPAPPGGRLIDEETGFGRVGAIRVWEALSASYDRSFIGAWCP